MILWTGTELALKDTAAVLTATAPTLTAEEQVEITCQVLAKLKRIAR